MPQIIAVGVGGFIGSCARFGITKLMTRFLPFFPFGTLLSNVLAGLFIGLIIGIERQAVQLPTTAKLFLTTGLLGGLSTFCTFSMDTVSFFERGRYLEAGANIILNVGLSLICVLGGLLIAKALFHANSVV